MNKITTFLLLTIAVTSSCDNKPAKLANGTWRATVKTETGTEIPFNFNVIDSTGDKYIDIINGSDRFRVDEVIVKSDSVNILMPLFSSEIKSVLDRKGNLTGKFIQHRENKKDVAMDFSAQPNITWRFFNIKLDSKYSVAGRWSVNFISQDNKDTTIAVGEFVQKGAKVTGTFLTRTGDYRFLQGAISDNKLYLSTFDGSNVFMFTGKLVDNNTITDGKFYSGLSSLKNWSAKRDESAMLPDAYSLTGLKPGHSSIDFSFPNTEGKTVALKDARFQNKVVVVQLFGSWCPNCMDETAYLTTFYNKYKDLGVEVVGLGYETSADFEKSKKKIQRLKDRLNVNYEMLVTGFTNKKEQVMKSLPALSTFVAFPTTIIIDKKGIVQRIHTGFTGPGTGNHYTEFKNQFEKTIDDLLKE